MLILCVCQLLICKHCKIYLKNTNLSINNDNFITEINIGPTSFASCNAVVESSRRVSAAKDTSFFWILTGLVLVKCSWCFSFSMKTLHLQNMLKKSVYCWKCEFQMINKQCQSNKTKYFKNSNTFLKTEKSLSTGKDTWYFQIKGEGLGENGASFIYKFSIYSDCLLIKGFRLHLDELQLFRC